MARVELLAERAQGNRYLEFVKSPKVWATAIVVIVFLVLAGTYKYWKPILSSSNQAKLASINGLDLSLSETYKNTALGLNFSYPQGWTVPVESVKNGVMLIQSPDKKLSLEFVKGVCYEASNVLCTNGYQITLGVPKSDDSAESDIALLNSIVSTVEFSK